MVKRLLIIGAGIEMLPIFDITKEIGLKTVVTDMNPNAPGFAYADDFIVASTRDVEETIKKVKEFSKREKKKIDGVMTIASDVPMTVAKVARSLGLPELPAVEIAEIVSDKLKMEELFIKKGVPVPWYKVITSFKELKEVIEEKGLPVVIKPIDNCGARGVYRITENEKKDLKKLYDSSMSFCRNSKTLIVEEFLEGPQVSAESIVYQGKVYTPGFSDRNYEFLEKYAPNMIENGGELPSALSKKDQQKIRQCVEKAAKALGMVNGVLKGDMVLNKGEAKVIEVAGRLSGGYFCTHETPLSTGVNIIKPVIQMALGEKVDVKALSPKYQKGVCERFFFPQPGKIKRIVGEEKLKRLSYVKLYRIYLKPGDVINPVTDHTKRGGIVLTVGKTREEAVKRAEDAVKMIKFEMEQGNNKMPELHQPKLAHPSKLLHPSKLYLTTVFHCNLNYSSIPVARRREVINTCYWPLLGFAERLGAHSGIKLGFEFSGRTLEIIEKLDKRFLEKIRELWQSRRIEVIGSGYAQSIFPLIPTEVNLRNLKLGNEIYKKLLGKQPEMAFVNEQTFSSGLVGLYLRAGYKAIIIDWPNAVKYNDWPSEEQYNSGFIEDNGKRIRVIWDNCLAFQKLQRYAYGNMTLGEYSDFVLSHYSKNKDRCLMIYGNDAEVFNFRPRNPQKLLHAGAIKQDEIKRLEEAFSELRTHHDIEFITPSECMKKLASQKVFKVGNPEQPIISKKQDKYNETRWAVCGRENYKSNTLCYEAYSLLRGLEKKGKALQSWWKILIMLWASDYRTFTTDEKWEDFRKTLLSFVVVLKRAAKKSRVRLGAEVKEGKQDNQLISIDKDKCIVDTRKVLLELSKAKGGTIKSLAFKDVSNKPLLKLLPHGYFNDISYSADFFSGHTIVFSGKEKLTEIGRAHV